MLDIQLRLGRTTAAKLRKPPLNFYPEGVRWAHAFRTRDQNRTNGGAFPNRAVEGSSWELGLLG